MDHQINITGITHQHVLAALSELRRGRTHTFGTPTKFHLVWEGQSFAPKAVVAIAYEKMTGQLPIPTQFRSGVQTGRAVTVLRGLGFTVIEAGQTGEDWTRSEVELIVASYFDMLARELRGETYSKTKFRNRLAPLLPARSKASIEFKHCNISAVMAALHQPYIQGYKPRANRQAMLTEVVEDYLDQHTSVLADERIAQRLGAVDAGPVQVANVAGLFEPPPTNEPTVQAVTPWKSRRGVRVDFAERDAANRRLGRLGEQFVVSLEQRRLTEAGRADLAERVVWAAQDVGDGLGYDVESFDERTEGPKWIEVKTTSLGKYFPFLITANELACSEAEPKKFHLYRVFEYVAHARVFVLPGSLRDRCRLDPVCYRAGPPFSAAG